jgi:nitrite reductase/ring-hydroxylating ferredoxin subunit
MKKYLTFIIFLIVVLSCTKDSIRNNNPYLPNYRFSSSVINLNLPLYNQLNFPGNAITYTEIGVGVLNKIFIINTGSNYLAFDAACPNQELSSCSSMNLVGIRAVCPCDDAEYSLFNGQSPGKQYPMVQYRVEVINPQTIRVYN